MNTQKSTHNWLNAILIFFVLVNILGDIANIVMWYINPHRHVRTSGRTRVS